MTNSQNRPLYSFLKRAFDLCVSLLLAFVFAPLFLIIAVLIKLDSKGPVIHWSKRVGKDNKIFPMPKFRTMFTDAPQVATHLLADPKAVVTKVGGILRKTSLDELPQVYSVLVGDMSLVGPRPALFNQDDLVALRTEKQVHTLVPGITGWAQINGRDELPIPVKVQFDREYLERRNFIFDIQIIFKTALKVLIKEGVSH